MDTGESRFGKYTLLSKLAAGGMAVTYRARLSTTAGVTKPVVIKKIHPHLAEEEQFVEMFIREAQLAATLTHGNIAQVFDFGDVKGEYFLAMEFVQGQALSRVLRRAADRDLPWLPIPHALMITTRMCDGLHYAHTRRDEQGRLLNLVHRDVSPENTLVSYEGEVKIVDFGIAKSTGGKQTETGMVKGKYPYFSPEQAEAARDLDARSDVYAVGVVLFEMLCGRRPFEGEFVAVMKQLAEGKMPRPTQFNPEIPPALEQVMLKALALDRKQRYASARDFGQAVSEVLHAGYPGSTAAELSALLAELFQEELEAEGLHFKPSPEVAAQLDAVRQPGYGAQRRAALGLKPEKATPRTPARPSATASKPNATPARANSLGAIPKAATGSRTALKPKEPEPETRVRPPAGRRPAPPRDEPPEEPERTPPDATLPDVPKPAPKLQVGPVKVAPLSLDSPEKAAQRQKLVVTLGGVGVGLSLLLLVGFLVFKKASSSGDEGTAGLPGDAGQLWVSSKPAGAKIQLDGKDVGVTPLRIPLAPGQHSVGLSLLGFKPWTQRFTLKPFEVKNLTPTLDSGDDAVVQPGVVVVDGKKDPVPPPATPDEGPAKTPEPQLQPAATPEDSVSAKRDVTWPVRLFVLRPAYNALPLDKYPTASIELNPATSYALGVSGRIDLGKGRAGNQVMYYLEGEMPEKNRLGFLTGAGKTLKGATRVHFFAIDDDVSDNSGALRIEFRVSKYVVPEAITFDAKENAIAPRPDHRFKLAGIKSSSQYLLTLRDDVSELAPGKAGKVGHVLCVLEPPEPKTLLQTHLLLEPNKRHTVGGTDSLTCLFPDLDISNNSGAIEIDIVDAAEQAQAPK